MGARPIALLDPLRFGDPDDAKTRFIVDGVVRGVGHYGNSLGVPTVGGETVFDPTYDGNPLVNVLCIGVLPADNIQLARAERSGDIAVLIGQRTGRDGIGGASVLASAEFGADGVDDAKRPNVQVGDPFAGKLLIESCLELYRKQLVRGIQDMGAAGIACSTSEMAANAGMGMLVDLDRVPLREVDMESWEILCSESQERMLALVDPVNVDEVVALCRRHGVDATPIGHVTDGDRLVCLRDGLVVHDAPAKALVHDGPVYERPMSPWIWPTQGSADTGGELYNECEQVLTSPNVAPPTWITEQYDAIVGSGTVAGPGGDAAVLRLPSLATVRGERLVDLQHEAVQGVAISTDGNGRLCALDPAEGARRVVAEAARNVACTGARPVAATNCLNFGSPERPDVMGAFSAVIDGLSDACTALGTPITGGNVSFYNSTMDIPIHPTPVVGVLGIIDDVARHVGHRFLAAGDEILLIGAQTTANLAGSEHQRVMQHVLGGQLDPIDLELEQRLQALLVAAAGQQLIRSAHDVSTGGLVATLVESAHKKFGARIVAGEPGIPIREWLFSESPSRVVVTTTDEAELRQRCHASDLHLRSLGRVTADRRLRLLDVLNLDLENLYVARSEALARALAGPSV
jgi:phosphoribosylformylglycinamidine synthase